MMKTITITIVAEWLTEDTQRKLEQNLAKLEVVKDFVFNEQGNLEVTFANSSDVVFVYNMCNIQIQIAMYQSGKDKMAELLNKDNQLFI